jgi:preprotein translocase subunit SecA
MEDTRSWDAIVDQVADAARQLYVWRERLVGPERMREDERNALLTETDRCWRDHLREMDYLRESIGLRSYGQKDPLLEYQREAFDYFGSLLEQIAQRTTRRLLRGTGHIDRRGVLLQNVQEGRGEDQEAMPSRPETYRKENKGVGRNDPCPCGSGLKYKRCCGVKAAVKA